MMAIDPEGFALERENLPALGLRIRVQGRAHQSQFVDQ